MESLREYNLSRIMMWAGFLLLLYFQYLFWFGEGGYFQRAQLQSVILEQEQKNTELAERNRILAAEVDDLKNGNMAVEEHARLDLGLVKPNETFVQMSTIQDP